MYTAVSFVAVDTCRVRSLKYKEYNLSFITTATGRMNNIKERQIFILQLVLLRNKFSDPLKFSYLNSLERAIVKIYMGLTCFGCY